MMTKWVSWRLSTFIDCALATIFENMSIRFDTPRTEQNGRYFAGDILEERMISFWFHSLTFVANGNGSALVQSPIRQQPEIMLSWLSNAHMSPNLKASKPQSSDSSDIVYHYTDLTGRHGVSNHRQLSCLCNHLFGTTSKENIKTLAIGPLRIDRWLLGSPHKGSVTRKAFGW